METASVIGAILYLIITIALFVLAGFFIYWQAKFLIQVPRYLQRIEEALSKIARK